MNRRRFLETIAQLGGAGAVYTAMHAMGLLAAPEGSARAGAKFALRGDGLNRRVIILGAGVAGLCAAYELGKLNYDCRIIEARPKVGGRCLTIRRGDVLVESDGRSQTCAFDHGEYFNAGATRIPQHHCTLDYCRELRVPVEQFGNLNEAAYLFRGNPGALAGQRVRLREVRSDMYGYAAELLAKAINRDALDERLSADDRRELVHYLAIEGGLSRNLRYLGGGRRGFVTWPGAALQHGEAASPLPLPELVRSGLGTMLAFNWGIEQQSTMFQIVGGVDRFAEAFATRIGSSAIEVGARVTEIRQSPSSVTVQYLDRIGRPLSADAEFCICTIPLSVLKRIPADFSPAMTRAIAAVDYEPATKIGLQFKRRFWEEDDHIYSGISRTDQSIEQIIYPSHGFLGEKGVLVGCYAFGNSARQIGDLRPDARIERALAEGGKIHPQYREEFENGVSVAWHKAPGVLGAFAGYDGQARREHYPKLNEPDGRVYLAGEHMSYLTGWIGGSLDSARRVSQMVHDRAMREPSPATTKPSTSPA